MNKNLSAFGGPLPFWQTGAFRVKKFLAVLLAAFILVPALAFAQGSSITSKNQGFLGKLESHTTGQNITKGKIFAAANASSTIVSTIASTFSGSISAVSGPSFTLQSKNRGALTVNTSSSTVFDKNGQVDPNGLADLVVGSNLNVTGIWDKTAGTVAANKINLIVRSVITTGTVASVSAPTITITGKNSTTYTVDTTNAKLVRRFGAAMAITDIQNGDSLNVTGVVTGTNIAATMVRNMSLQAHNGTFEGSVAAINGSSFTLQSKNRGPQTINTTGTTVFRMGGASTSIASLAVAQTVTVSGVWDRTNSNVTANRVSIKVSTSHITGTVQSVSGNTVSVLSSSTNYSVDASSAKINYAHGHKGDISILQNGDSVGVWGKYTTASTSLTASLIIDNSRTFKTATSTP